MHSRRYAVVFIFSTFIICSERSSCRLCLSAAIANVLAWLISLKLKFNSSETEFIVIGTCQQRFKVDISFVKDGSSDSYSVRSLCAWFDVNTKCQWTNTSTKHAVMPLEAFTILGRYTDVSQHYATKPLVHAFVTSHLDCCNSLLFGRPVYQN